MTDTPAADTPETTVRAALRMHAATRALANSTLEPLHGGLSNYAWKASDAGPSWFVRLGGPDSTTLGVDRLSERALLEVVDATGLAPPLRACDPSSGLLVTLFIEGGPWRSEHAHQARNIDRLAERLRVLHALDPPAGVRRIDFATQAHELGQQLHVARVGRRRACADDHRELDVIEDTSGSGTAIGLLAKRALATLASRRPRPVPCHNDLHHLNLLDDGNRLWIVDWEYGGVGDPLFDLASYACLHEFRPVERSALLDAYGAGSAIPASALDAACTVFDCVQWLWYRLWAARHPDNAGEYVARAKTLAGRLAGSGR